MLMGSRGVLRQKSVMEILPVGVNLLRDINHDVCRADLFLILCIGQPASSIVYLLVCSCEENGGWLRIFSAMKRLRLHTVWDILD